MANQGSSSDTQLIEYLSCPPPQGVGFYGGTMAVAQAGLAIDLYQAYTVLELEWRQVIGNIPSEGWGVETTKKDKRLVNASFGRMDPDDGLPPFGGTWLGIYVR